MIIFLEILILILLSIKHMYLTFWLLSLSYFKSYHTWSKEKDYRRIIIDYPVSDCVKPKKFKFLYKELELSDKGIPKEMYYIDLLQLYGLIPYTIILFAFSFINKDLSLLTAMVYVLFIASSEVVCELTAGRKSFYARYKLLNWQTFKCAYNSSKDPEPEKIGSCEIVDKVKRRGKYFATIKMVETGRMKSEVLITRVRREDESSVYTLYKICNVFYAE